MTANAAMHRSRRMPRDVATHIFAVGQAVRLNDGNLRSAKPTVVYHITGILPPVGDSPQYRIRNDEQRHERMATQESLEAFVLTKSGDDSTLIERTFGRG